MNRYEKHLWEQGKSAFPQPSHPRLIPTASIGEIRRLYGARYALFVGARRGLAARANRPPRTLFGYLALVPRPDPDQGTDPEPRRIPLPIPSSARIPPGGVQELSQLHHGDYAHEAGRRKPERPPAL